MPTFREPCSPLHQDEEQPDTELPPEIVPFYITLLVGVGTGEEENCGGGEEQSRQFILYIKFECSSLFSVSLLVL